VHRERVRFRTKTKTKTNMLLAVSLGLLVAWLIVRPVIAVRDGLEAMASGDLTTRVDVRTTDEVGQMAVALNRAADGVGETVRATAEPAASRPSAMSPPAAARSPERLPRRPGGGRHHRSA
jgi:methyl-accepting chemotaxis protein